MIVLDTCALIWWTLDPTQLSPKAVDACKRMEGEGGGGFVSSISIWEIGIKVKKGKLEIGLPIQDFVARLKKTNVVQIVPVDDAVWLENLALPWEHPDPADRTIVATARLRGLPLLTPDRLITAFYPQTVW
jgi:PIN domain nuclease of toxin-antitoxin system